MTDKKASQGLSLIDIGDWGEDVDIGTGEPLRVRGISAQGVLQLLIRFPDLKKWLQGSAISVNEVLVQTPDAVAAIIAAGTGGLNNPDAEDKAAMFPIEIQVDLLEAIYRQTFRSGFGPFALRVLKLIAAAQDSGNFGKDPDTKSPQEFEALIAAGHSATDVWGYTPRRIMAFLFLAARRKDRDNYDMLGLSALGSRGDKDEVNKQLQTWESEF